MINKSRFSALGLAAVLIFALAGVAWAQRSAGYGLGWHSVNGGGAQVSGSGQVGLNGTLGQFAIGSTGSSSYKTTSGYWYIQKAAAHSGDIYLPVIIKGFASSGPDLVIDNVDATGSGATVTIRNAGNKATPDDFWVDLYFNPNPAPPSINRPWDTIAQHGGYWGVTVTLNPGDSLILTTGDKYYAGGSSTFPAGANVYAYVDSINYATTYGNILESNEGNNVFGPVVSTAGSGAAVVTSGSLSSLDGLPPR